MISIPIEQVQPNPWQTRLGVDQAHVIELANDILGRKDHRPDTLGLLQLPAGRAIDADGEPVTKWMPGFNIQLAFGHNRLAAFAFLADQDPDYNHMPLELVLFNDQEMATAAWAENAQRQDLSPIEQAEAIKRMMDSFKWKQTRIGKHLGLSRSAVSNKLRLLRLEGPARDAVLNGDITERQAMAILPALSMPPEAYAQISDNDYWTPDRLIELALSGSTSDALRSSAASTIRNLTADPTDRRYMRFPLDHAFDLDGIQAARCDKCRIRVRLDDQKRCPDQDCREKKRITWRSSRLAEASEITGLPFTDPETDQWTATDRFWGSDPELIKETVENGCKYGYLHLQWAEYDGANAPPGFDDIAFVCVHGGDGGYCKCMANLKRAKGREEPEDPRIAAERERKKQIEKEIVKPAAAVLAAAIADGQTGAWSNILKVMSWGYKIDPDRDLDYIRDRMARLVITQNWKGYAQQVEDVRANVEKGLERIGLPVPWAEELPVLEEEQLAAIDAQPLGEELSSP